MDFIAAASWATSAYSSANVRRRTSDEPSSVTIKHSSTNKFTLSWNIKLGFEWHCQVGYAVSFITTGFSESLQCCYVQKLSFLAWDVIYTFRTYAMTSVSICLWRLCIVVIGCNGSQIPLHAWIDGCLCYLLTTPHPDRRIGWCRDFWWKRGGVISSYASHC